LPQPLPYVVPGNWARKVTLSNSPVLPSLPKRPEGSESSAGPWSATAAGRLAAVVPENTFLQRSARCPSPHSPFPWRHGNVMILMLEKGVEFKVDELRHRDTDIHAMLLSRPPLQYFRADFQHSCMFVLGTLEAQCAIHVPSLKTYCRCSWVRIDILCSKSSQVVCCAVVIRFTVSSAVLLSMTGRRAPSKRAASTGAHHPPLRRSVVLRASCLQQCNRDGHCEILRNFTCGHTKTRFSQPHTPES
jgi:hypothetical protein